MPRTNHYRMIAHACQRTAASGLLEEVFQLFAAARMAKLAQRLRFDLSNTLTRDTELLADFLQRAGSTVIKSKPQAKHLFLARRQRVPHVFQLLDRQTV